MKASMSKRFYSSPSCDGDHDILDSLDRYAVSILPRLATGITKRNKLVSGHLCFYSSPSCDGDRSSTLCSSYIIVSILPRLATGIDNG